MNLISSSRSAAIDQSTIQASQTTKSGRSLTDEKISSLTRTPLLTPKAQESFEKIMALQEKCGAPRSELYEKLARLFLTHDESNLMEMQIVSSTAILSQDFTGNATILISDWNAYIMIECEDGLVKKFTELDRKATYFFRNHENSRSSYQESNRYEFTLSFNYTHNDESITPCRIQLNAEGNKLECFWIFEEFVGRHAPHKTFEEHIFHLMQKPDEEVCTCENNLVQLFINGSSKEHLDGKFTGDAYLNFKGWSDYLIIKCQRGFVTQFTDKFYSHHFSDDDSYSKCRDNHLSKVITRMQVSADGTMLLCFLGDKRKPTGCSLM